MLERFVKELETCRVGPGARILLAVSGGPDSMAMLHLFHEAREELSFHMEVAHLHHGIRGQEADKDARLVEEACKTLGITFHLLRFDVPRFAAAKKISLEEAGRRIRHHLLNRLAKARSLDYIAFGHTADDQVETVLMNFFRGAGPRGLSGISPVRDRIIHPMLTFSKAELVTFLQENGFSYRKDVSNDDACYTRNRIRHEVIPFLEAQFPGGFKEPLLRSAEIFREEEAWLETVIAQIFHERFRRLDGVVCALALSSSEALPVALQRRLVRKLIETATHSLDGVTHRDVDQILDLLNKGTGKRFEFLKYVVERIPEGIALSCKLEPWKGEVPIAIPGETRVVPLGLRLQSALLNSPNKIKSAKNEVFLDLEKIDSPVVLRTRRDGDTFSVLGLSRHKKKLQDYFVNRKVPKLLRDRVPLLACSRGILWVGGYDANEQFKVTDTTRHVLHVKVIHE